jgi:aspartate racemase
MHEFQHIGIVACSVPGAALCYTTIAKLAKKYYGEWGSPTISLHNFPLKLYMKYIEARNWEKVADLMVKSAQILEQAGANIIICPDNTIHEAFENKKIILDRKWLHIAEEVAKIAKSKNYKCLAILGTKFLMEGPVYMNKLKAHKIEYYIPDRIIKEKINDFIFSELVYGTISEEAIKFFKSIIADFRENGCDAFVAGCTEIPLIIDKIPKDQLAIECLDSTRILAKAALIKAVKNEDPENLEQVIQN